MIKGYLSYPEMLQVFNLVLFSLTFGTAVLDFSESSRAFANDNSHQSPRLPRPKPPRATLSAFTR